MALFGSVALAAPASGQTRSQLDLPPRLERGDTLVLGFLGGWERWDSARRGVRKVTLDLRARALPGVYAETFSNHRRALALQVIQELLGRNGDARLDAGKRGAARIVVYGQSYGGGAVVKLARELDRLGVPVLLTVQVDSIGRGDDRIPANVAGAVNFFQRESWPLVGVPSISAVDPSRTRILGNFEYHTAGHTVDASSETWLRRRFLLAHHRMELDPELWQRVEELILTAIAQP